MSDDSTNLRQEFVTELESILESDEAYGSNLQILIYALKEDVINGKFKDSWNNRVYEFIIDIDGISYKPAAKLDSFSADELPTRFDSYSEGYASLFVDVRLDRKVIGKRTKKPKCGVEAFGCGYSCINLLKTCRITPLGKKIGESQGASIGKERLNKLLTSAKKLYSEGDKKKSWLANVQARNIESTRSAHASKGEKRQIKRQAIVKNKTEALSNKEFKSIGNAETREKLNQWIETNTKLNELSERRAVKGIDKKRILAAVEIVESLLIMKDDKNVNFSGVVDSEGNLQSAYICRETDKGYYVDYLASAPWNSLPDHPSKKTGAGASAIEAIVRKAVSAKKVQVDLESTRSAIPFYEKVGFKKQKGGEPSYPDMMLNEENARKFLKAQEDKYRKDAEVSATINELTELEMLEEEVLGLFTIPQNVHKQVIEKIESRKKQVSI